MGTKSLAAATLMSAFGLLATSSVVRADSAQAKVTKVWQYTTGNTFLSLEGQKCRRDGEGAAQDVFVINHANDGSEKALSVALAAFLSGRPLLVSFDKQGSCVISSLQILQ